MAEYQLLHYIWPGVRFNNEVKDCGRWAVSLSSQPNQLEPMYAGENFDGFYGDTWHGDENEQFWHAIESMTTGEGKDDGTPVILTPAKWLKTGDIADSRQN